MGWSQRQSRYTAANHRYIVVCFFFRFTSSLFFSLLCGSTAILFALEFLLINTSTSLSTPFSSFDWCHFSFVYPHAHFISICHGHDLVGHHEGVSLLCNRPFFVCLCFYLAFDPAYPGFDGPNARRRLAKSDAKFVDVIHTNARTGLSNAVGIETPLGHADFYPNGGSRMPGCIGFSFQTSKEAPMRPIRNLIWRFCLINDGF